MSETLRRRQTSDAITTDAASSRRRSLSARDLGAAGAASSLDGVGDQTASHSKMLPETDKAGGNRGVGAGGGRRKDEPPEEQTDPNEGGDNSHHAAPAAPAPAARRPALGNAGNTALGATGQPARAGAATPAAGGGTATATAGAAGQQPVPAAGSSAAEAAAGAGAANRGRVAVAKYEYVGQGPEQLSFRVGDIVQLHTEKVNNMGWGLGQANGKVGWFPGDFVDMRPTASERKRGSSGSKTSGTSRRQNLHPNPAEAGGGGDGAGSLATPHGSDGAGKDRPPPPYPGRNRPPPPYPGRSQVVVSPGVGTAGAAASLDRDGDQTASHSKMLPETDKAGGNRGVGAGGGRRKDEPPEEQTDPNEGGDNSHQAAPAAPAPAAMHPALGNAGHTALGATGQPARAGAATPAAGGGTATATAGAAGQQPVPAAGSSAAEAAAGAGAANRGRVAVAKYEFVGQGPEQLSFRVGDIVQLHTEKVNAKGWGLGQANGKVGWFPGDFVDMRPTASERTRGSSGSKTSGTSQRQNLHPNPAEAGGGGDDGAGSSVTPHGSDGAGKDRPPPPYPGRNEVSEDRASLEVLFRSTGGTRWKQSNNWYTDAGFSQWHGVHLDQDGRVVKLNLSYNNLTGSIPSCLGSLSKLQQLWLNGNQLAGPIPESLRALKELTHLVLDHNELTGVIPTWLGSLNKLQGLALNGNRLVGPIREELGALRALTILALDNNKLTGHVPKALGNLENLQKLSMENNKLTGTIPIELGNLSALSTFRFGNTGLKGILGRGNRLTGGPAEGEGLDWWRERMRDKHEILKGGQKENSPAPAAASSPVSLRQRQETDEGDNSEKDTPLALASPTQREDAVAKRTISPENYSFSPDKAEADRMFRAQLSSLAGLDSLVRDNPEALEDLQRVIEATVAGNIFPQEELSDMERRRKLSTLVTMSTALGEVALRHTGDMDVQRKEQALSLFSRAYYTTVRTGICNAYLAASVIDSDWVSTCKTGGMGKAGAGLKLLSSAVPVIGGLPNLAGKALETGDHYLQTRRLVKIAAMASDATECCALARRLALLLTDGLKDDTSAAPDDAGELRVHTTADMNGAAGGSGFGRGAGNVPGVMSEDDIFEYLLEEVASYERNDYGGKRLGKKHLRKLLKAIQRGCLDGSNCTQEKIEVLVLEIVPEAHIRPAATPSIQEKTIVGSPTATPARDSGLPSKADFSAMQAALEELASANDQHQAELEAMKETQEAELQALKSANKKLQRKVINLEKYVPAPDSEPEDSVDVGGLALRRRVAVTETAEGFLDRARDRAAAAADHHPVTVNEQREFEALQNEKHREHEARFRELEGEIRKTTKRKGRR